MRARSRARPACRSPRCATTTSTGRGCRATRPYAGRGEHLPLRARRRAARRGCSRTAASGATSSTSATSRARTCSRSPRREPVAGRVQRRQRARRAPCSTWRARSPRLRRRRGRAAWSPASGARGDVRHIVAVARRAPPSGSASAREEDFDAGMARVRRRAAARLSARRRDGSRALARRREKVHDADPPACPEWLVLAVTPTSGVGFGTDKPPPPDPADLPVRALGAGGEGRRPARRRPHPRARPRGVGRLRPARGQPRPDAPTKDVIKALQRRRLSLCDPPPTQGRPLCAEAPTPLDPRESAVRLQKGRHALHAGGELVMPHACPLLGTRHRRILSLCDPVSCDDLLASRAQSRRRPGRRCASSGACSTPDGAPSPTWSASAACRRAQRRRATPTTPAARAEYLGDGYWRSTGRRPSPARASAGR